MSYNYTKLNKITQNLPNYTKLHQITQHFIKLHKSNTKLYIITQIYTKWHTITQN